jgi:hypothetical protein
MLNIFFNGGIFGKTIADVNVHERLGLANEVAQPSAFLRKLYTPFYKAKAEIEYRKLDSVHVLNPHIARRLQPFGAAVYDRQP